MPVSEKSQKRKLYKRNLLTNFNFRHHHKHCWENTLHHILSRISHTFPLVLLENNLYKNWYGSVVRGKFSVWKTQENYEIIVRSDFGWCPVAAHAIPGFLHTLLAFFQLFRYALFFGFERPIEFIQAYILQLSQFVLPTLNAHLQPAKHQHGFSKQHSDNLSVNPTPDSEWSTST